MMAGFPRLPSRSRFHTVKTKNVTLPGGTTSEHATLRHT
jgi:hypothetical protein